ncbi:MAG: class I SAM-dependent methyltransferase, partial [Deltaproteobacteria bacterium]|nr:class I SAM-dependent methyltransferase [Deltaproteobacteria bacterium]
MCEPVEDEVFDALYPRIQRLRASVHWTPVRIALRVAELLAPAPGGHVLDVGAGVGKVCIIGALGTPLVWHGIERGGAMVRSARNVARRLGVADRTHFIEGDALTLDLAPFGGCYL